MWWRIMAVAGSGSGGGCRGEDGVRAKRGLLGMAFADLGLAVFDERGTIAAEIWQCGEMATTLGRVESPWKCVLMGSA